MRVAGAFLEIFAVLLATACTGEHRDVSLVGRWGPGPTEVRQRKAIASRTIALNDGIANTAHVDTLRPGGSTGLDLTGAGVLLGEWDEGAARDTHRDLRGRAFIRDGSGLSDHATHGAATMAGTGAVDPQTEGMAPGARLFSYSFELDLVEMADFAPFFAASSHAYGTALGWQENPTCPDQWSWAGERGELEDARFGRYGVEAAALDRVVRATDVLSVWAAGNDRDDGPASQVNPHAHFPSCDAVFSDEHRAERNFEYDTLGVAAVAKNVLTVGAVVDLPARFTANDIEPLRSSSFGPTDDGRIKPDVVAGGDTVRSAAGGTDDAYAVQSGTSSSAAALTGIAALLVEAYRTHHAGRDPRAAELKAALVETALDAGSRVGPDYRIGYGLVDARAAAELVAGADGDTRLRVDVLTGGPNTLATADVAAGTPLRVTLAWMDPAGPPRAAADDRTPVLENDLELELVAPDGVTVFHPWSLDPEAPDVAATRDAANHLDNVEVVDVDARDNTLSGRWTVRVHTERELLRGEPQPYALAASLAIATPRRPLLGSAAHVDFAVPPTGTASLSLPIDNLGSGSLEWTASVDVPWLELERTHGAEGDDVVLLARASELPAESPSFARVTIESNDPGGPRTIGVVVERTCSADCSGRDCGPDPVCGTPCGRCDPRFGCTPSGTCEPLASGCPAAELGSVLGSAVVSGVTNGTSSLSASCGGELAADTGFGWQAPHAGRYAFSTEGSGFDTVLSLHRGGCSGLELGCNDDTADLTSSVVADLATGEAVTAVVDGFDGASGVFSLGIHEVRCPDGELGSALGSNVLPAASPGRLDRLRPSCAPVAAREAALGFTAPASGTYRFDASASTYDASIAVLSGDCDGDELACASEAVEVELSAGEHVVIVIDGAIVPDERFALAITTRDLTCGGDCEAKPGGGLCACDEHCVALGDCCVDACGECPNCRSDEECEFGRCIPRRCVGGSCGCGASTGGTGASGCHAGEGGEPGEAGGPASDDEPAAIEPAGCTCALAGRAPPNGLAWLGFAAGLIVLASPRGRIYKARMKLLGFLLLLALGTVACGPKAVRGSETPGLDDQAMSTGLDKKDLEKLLSENMKALQKAPVIQRWSQEDKPTVAVIPLRNETSEHVDSTLDALISDIETTLVNAGHVRVISMDQQPKLVEEIRRQYSAAFDQSQIAGYGKQLGAKYIVTGKVYSADERQSGERRVQYFMFIQVLSVETGEILFQNKTSVTKALI